MNLLTESQQEHLKAAIQDGLPLTATPYRTLALQLDLPEPLVMAQIKHWTSAGYIKRLGLVVRHHAVGYRANAMVVWDVDDDQVDAVGDQLRGAEGVTLCYRRRRQAPHWPYNLYCMIHGKSREVVLQQLERITQRYSLQHIPRSILFSNQQFKQTGGHYARRAS
ncbi:MAG: AsnC family protein [Pseudomonadales bacterium]|uniref:siroheme decarboxylase subunit beta n=1 Tax=unclassified Ketobacter TaxID=2639109 RepID=UPI000C647822|nr:MULTISPECIES: AsnC family protein [unclassified Ketobacter]MAA60102.1 AsnC family protein [Pseudomonadales bacterium]MEC8813445.1 AsnC family protein [Pseudomonadota bacterium]TNC85664.1 MAG: AsnC family protein [Alcanivorax sp.]HAU12230.1 AsnC family protein [Gammaproteobacteria bacterium]MAQ23408.1 AsnC family protein [Pseudomonadales bacterium]|tara:strand:+ start:1273 stop:1767 length:495 start_codon:yes stop_codon:yes gene_type:complete